VESVIKDLSITAIIGMYVLLGLESILHFVFAKGVTGFYTGDNVGLNTGTANALAVAASLAVGMIVEDVSLRQVDDKTLPVSAPFDKITRRLDIEMQNGTDLHPIGTRFDLRLSQLAVQRDGSVHPHDFSKDSKEPPLKPTPLGSELARVSAFTLASPNDPMVATVQEWFKSAEGPTPPTQPLLDHINIATARLYYFAKNRVYAKPTYFSEMTKIQGRLDFSRSVALISFFYCGVCVVLVAAHAFPAPTWWSRIKRIPVTLVLLLLFASAYMAAVWAYHRESDEFNKRAFGYYSGIRLACQALPANVPCDVP
jgi:hypothetical protein